MSSQKRRRTKTKQKLSVSSSLRLTSLALDTDFTEMKLEDFTTAKPSSQLRSSKSMQKVGDVPKDKKKKQKARVPTTTEIEIKVNKTNKKSEELEDLGDGLKMREFLIRQADTQVLTLKIEERNSDLNRLHTKCNDDVHALAHLKNKEHMWRNTHERNVKHLQDCIDRNTKFREQIYRGKLEHNAISREISKLRFDGGLMQYPALLEDFDQTVSDLNAKRKSVEKLRNTHKSLLNRIRLAEQLADAVTRRKSIKSTGSIRKSALLEAADLAKQLRISALSK
ncbi:coiled-coil domain-containing protein 96 isoform X2 [Drosophila sulfurigaster albostrigata]|uniref:coiled-coil domain-containing protein 96 isoform X2 n=1 Tax=Drosophila sulfurigaster albostrigata TaxID=89887 RepID=UPI002D21AB10|nr:coiled-coil domain-containing protein 96 isoform X2 [Drosophila sulfurigaster albostrigata]